MDLHETSLDWYRRTPRTTRRFRQVRSAALAAMRSGTAYLVDGTSGTEKTFSLRSREREINDSGEGRAVYVYARIAIRRSRSCGVLPLGRHPRRRLIDQLLRKLRTFLGSKRQCVVLIVDEAQHLDHKGLEVLRQLLDLPPFFGVVLGGSHDLPAPGLADGAVAQPVAQDAYINGPVADRGRPILRAGAGELTDADCDETRSRVSRHRSGQRPSAARSSRSSHPTLCARPFGAIERAKEVLPPPIRPEAGPA